MENTETNALTIGRFKELIKDLPDDTILNIVDMEDFSFYPNEDSISLQEDYDTPRVEIIMPVYISKLAIEPDNECELWTGNAEVEENED